MLKLFTYVDVTPDLVDFGGQRVVRPDGIGAMQWLDFWEMAKDCRETIARLENSDSREIQNLEDQIEELEDQIEELEGDVEGLNSEIRSLERELDDKEEELSNATKKVAQLEEQLEKTRLV